MARELSRRAFLRVVGVATGGVCAAALASCQPRVVVEEEVVTEPVVPVEVQPPVTVQFWGWPGPVWDDKLAVFKEKAPHITVSLSEIGDAVFRSAKFLTAEAAGTGPDVSIANRHTFQQFAARQMYKDVTPFFDAAGLKRADYLTVQLEETSWAGTLYGLPIMTDTRFLYWNRKHFEEVGLDPDTPPQTYAELEAFADRLNKRDGQGNIERYGFVPYLFGNSWMWLYGFLNKAPSLSDDKRTVLADDPRWIETLDWMVRFYDNYVGEFELANAFSASITAAGLGEPFDAGKVSMVAHGNWAVGSFLRIPDLDWDSAPMPIPPEGQMATWSCGWSLVIPPSALEPEAGWELMLWWTTEEGWRAEAEAQVSETARIWEREQIEGTPQYWPDLACHKPSLAMLANEYIPKLGAKEQKTWEISVDLLENWTRGCGTEMGLAALEYWVEMDNAARVALSHEKTPAEALMECKRKVQEATDTAWAAIDEAS